MLHWASQQPHGLPFGLKDSYLSILKHSKAPSDRFLTLIYGEVTFSVLKSILMEKGDFKIIIIWDIVTLDTAWFEPWLFKNKWNKKHNEKFGTSPKLRRYSGKSLGAGNFDIIKKLLCGLFEAKQKFWCRHSLQHDFNTWKNLEKTLF